MASASSSILGAVAENDELVPTVVTEPPRNGSGCNNQDPMPQQSSAKRDKHRGAVLCRFFTSKKGCRAGSSCPYSHDVSTTESQSSSPTRLPRSTKTAAERLPEGQVPAPKDSLSQASTEGVVPARDPRVLPKPIPFLQTTDPRQFELNQLKSRFSPSIGVADNATVLTFKLVPTDPDFPFELPGLQCILSVPDAYPAAARPSLRIANSELERGYQINIERGFDNLVAQYPSKTLLGLMNELDKHLETFLSSEKAPTIKLVSNASKKIEEKVPTVTPRPVAQYLEQAIAPPAPIFGSQETAAARDRRGIELQQLEARLGRHPSFSKQTGQDQKYDLPLQVKRSELPSALQSVDRVRLTVPPLYNLAPCTIEIMHNTSREARSVEIEFERQAREHPERTLMSHVNYLSQNMHKMVHDDSREPSKNAEQVVANLESAPEVPKSATIEKSEPCSENEGSPHIKIVPRPPEWDITNAVSDSDESSDYSDAEVYDTDEDDDGGAPVPEAQRAAGPERGVMISFPEMEMYGVELLEIATLSVTVKCNRCKDVLDIKNVQSSAKTQGVTARSESCKKCASTVSVAYRGEPMHSNSIRAGYLDLEDCTIVEMLPSKFQPTCSECSTTYTASDVVSVRGENTLTICRECHKKMTFKIPQIRFLRVSNEGQTNRPLPPRKRPKENLGIVAGTELPRRGRCQHYAKSYRWFRFGCCGKVYACDRCHNEAEEHPNEHAGRMICGFCSREQVYRPEECGSCGRSVVGRKGGGFWEGGKGTRDRVRMSRKDPRKYKRRGPAKASE